MADDSRNVLLSALNQPDYALIRPHLTRMHLDQHAVLQRVAEPIENIIFPTEGMISLLATVPTGQEVEIAGIGREGAIGTKVGLLPHISFATAIVQLPGLALKIPVERFQEAALGNAALTHIATCANDVMLVNLQQAAACNALHETEARLARWILHARDRYDADVMPLTQEFLAQMLGVRRTTVTLVAALLEKKGLVEHERGRIKIIDRPGMEKMACGCYGLVRENVGKIIETAKRASLP